MEAYYSTHSPAETIQLGLRLAEYLCQRRVAEGGAGGVAEGAGNRVLLYGDLGSGKTHFAKGIAEGLGIRNIIKSPTYVYVNDYEVPADPGRSFTRLYHYDLYRFQPGEDTGSIGLDETLEDPFALNVIEWADRLDRELSDRAVLLGLEGVESDGAEALHRITLRFLRPDVVSEADAESFAEQWAMPRNVREHCAQVAHVAFAIGQAYVKAGAVIDLHSLAMAARLHDLARVCDFLTLRRDKHPEVSDAVFALWERLREEHRGAHHGDIACEFLAQKGYTETARLIRLHKTLCLVQEPASFDDLESRILYYADKRVKHTEIVSLEERFRDGRERYGEADDPEERALYERAEEQTHGLEKALFEPIGLEPGGIA